jgi:hypothetical protein
MADRLPAVPEVGFTGEADFEAWLTGLPDDKIKPIAQVLSCRAALRVLPALAIEFTVGRTAMQIARVLTFTILRASSISRIALKYRTREIKLAADSAHSAALSTAVFAVLSTAASAALSAALSAVDSALSAIDSARSAASSAAESAASSAARSMPNSHTKFHSGYTPGDSPVDVAASAARSTIWKALTADARALTSGTVPLELLATPLWPGDEMPGWWVELRGRLQARLELLDRDATRTTGDSSRWSIWSQWYNSVAQGRPPWSLPSEAAWEIEKRIGLGNGRSDEFWKREPDEINREIAEWVDEARNRAFKLPEPPEQKLGLRFAVVNKLIRLVRYSGLGSDKANLERIQGQLPLLRRLVRKLERRLCEGEMPRDGLVDSLSALSNVLDRNQLDAVGVAELYANTLVFRDQLAEAQTPATGANVFPFEGADLSSAKSIVTISDMIVQATPEGRELFDDAEKSDLDAGEFEKYRELELELLDRIAADGHIMDAEELALLKNILIAGNRGPVPRKTMHLSSGSMRNIVNTLTGAGVVGAIGYVVIANPIGAIAVGFFARLFLGEGIKQSVVGKTVNGFITDRIDRSMVDFFLNNRDLLEEISKDRRGYDWTREILEKIKLREDEENGKK